MTFVFPILLGGLALAGIPVLLHLIVRQKPKRLPFPAFRFLVQQRRSNLRKLRLRQLLLLALRGRSSGFDVGLPAMHALIAIGPAAVPALLATLCSEPGEHTCRAIEALAGIAAAYISGNDSRVIAAVNYAIAQDYIGDGESGIVDVIDLYFA